LKRKGALSMCRKMKRKKREKVGCFREGITRKGTTTKRDKCVYEGDLWGEAVVLVKKKNTAREAEKVRRRKSGPEKIMKLVGRRGNGPVPKREKIVNGKSPSSGEKGRIIWEKKTNDRKKKEGERGGKKKRTKKGEEGWGSATGKEGKPYL